jgi:glycosyltransferase involved in cell wall biosynthesis
MNDWLLVSGDFTTHGGMDAANFALASYLARRTDVPGDERAHVHLVSHAVAADLASLPAVTVHRVPRPFGIHRLGEPLLRFTAKLWQRRLAGRHVRVVANGGNADAGDLNWVHYLHAAFTPTSAGPINRLRTIAKHHQYLEEESRALRRARAVICNSRRTAEDVVRLAGVARARVRVVYYGTDPARFSPVDEPVRRSSRQTIGLPADRPLALFVGALGDRRKAFDTLFEAWRLLCERPDWDVDLVVAGTGAELPAWRSRAASQLPEGRMRLLGFRRDMPAVFAACDLLVHPARYEAYGLAVHEALCRGIPALVTRSAGVAERYPEDLRSLLIDDPDSAASLAAQLLAWRGDSTIRARLAPFAATLRARTWDHMAADIAAIAEAYPIEEPVPAASHAGAGA